MLFFLLYVLKIGIGFCSFLCSVEPGHVLPGKFIINTLALSVVWYWGSVVKPLLYFEYHLMETINSYTSYSASYFCRGNAKWHTHILL